MVSKMSFSIDFFGPIADQKVPLVYECKGISFALRSMQKQSVFCMTKLHNVQLIAIFVCLKKGK